MAKVGLPALGRRTAVGFMVVMLLALTYPIRPASAQPTGSLELVAQSAFVTVDELFDLQVRVAGASIDANVVVRVHPPVRTRTQFLSGLPGDSEPLLQIGPTPLADLQTTSNEILSLQLAIVGPDTPEPEPDPDADPDDDPNTTIPVLVTDGSASVYPVEVILQDAEGAVADSLVTHLIELPGQRSGLPLNVVLVVPIELPPGIGPDGFFALEADAGAELVNVLDAMEIHDSTFVALDISPSSLAAVQRSSAPLHVGISERLPELIEPEELFTTSYVTVDEQAWLDADLGRQLGTLYDHGGSVTHDLLGEQTDTSVAILDPTLDPSGLEWIADRGVQGVLVESSHLAPLDTGVFNRSLTREFLIPTSTGRTVPALAIDRQLTRHFTEPGNDVLKANRMLADLTLLALDDPSLRRSAVIDAPDAWTPSLAFLNVLLSGIERIPLLASATPGDALAQTSFAPAAGDGTISPPLRRELRPVTAPSLGSYRTDYNQAIAAVRSWGTVIAGDPDSTERLYELLRESAAAQHAPETQAAYIDTVYRLIDEQKGRALVAPPSERITLTGRETTIPVIIENRLSVDLSVILLFDSEKLAFPEGKERPQILVPGQNRLDVPIEALASGDSPIRVQILSPDRQVLLGSSEVVVRTFAFSGVGIIIGAGAITVLLIWWLRHRRTRRATLRPALAT